jgi:hypothetical protein
MNESNEVCGWTERRIQQIRENTLFYEWPSGPPPPQKAVVSCASQQKALAAFRGH